MSVIRKSTVVISALALLALSGCGNGSEAGTAGNDQDVTLAAPTWAGGQANTAVAEYLLETELGYDVSVRQMDEDDLWKAIGTGRADAILEDWGHPDLEKEYIDKKKTVVPAGDLGVTGHIGWYVPAYLAAEHPEITDYKNLNDFAELLATPKSGGKGQLLEGSPKFVTRDEEIIENLGLDFEAVYAGSEAAQLKVIQEKARKKEPFLTYWWRPHWLGAEVELDEVDLPPHYEGCEDDAAVECGYPETELQKYLNADFEKEGGKAAGFLKNFQWPEEEQNKVARMIADEGLSPRQAAKKWAEENPGIWKVWLWNL